MQVVFACYYSFASNSGAHLFALANHLARRGVCCSVFLPFDKESVGPHGSANFAVRTFDELETWVDELCPKPDETLLVTWTPRENVRNFAVRFRKRIPCRYAVHLEDNERLITATNLGLSVRELAEIPAEKLDARFAPDERLSHPHRFPRFIAESAGITALIDRLAELAPLGHPCHVFWPGFNANLFKAAPINFARRRQLGIGDKEVVLVYTGNVHSANRREVLSLYLAVRALNRMGIPTRLVRTGEDYARVLDQNMGEIQPHVIELGKIPLADVPLVQAMANFLVQPGRADDFNDYRFPSKVPEFFALGRPVIIPKTNLGRFVRDREDCLLLHRGDALEIADLVAELHRSPATSGQLAQAARRFADAHFRWEDIAGRLETYFRQLLNSTPAPASDSTP
jgi:glycosyltransferase involved in cell wall biosynthesis